MTPPLRILVVEDNPVDVELLERELRRGGIAYEKRHVETEEAFLKELGEFKPQIVISDYSLPRFDGLSALRLLQERSPATPFLFVSGTIGEEVAVEALKCGATDYILKGHMKRLAPAVQRAIAGAEEHAEKERLEQQFLHSQRMEAIGRLAGGVAHDFNNLLTVINGYSDLMLRRLPASDPLHREISEVRRAGERAADLTRQLLGFARRQIVDPKALDLNAVVASMDSLLRRLIGEDIDLQTIPAKDLGTIRADRGQIEQVLMNLAVNARDAMPQGGKLTIETANTDLDETYARTHVGVTAGPHVLLAVSDTGSGIPAEILPHIFEPFFTTKPKGEGTGLGLPMVYGAVKQSGGSIWVYSEPGRGATFKLYFPQVDAPPDAATTGGPAREIARGWETVLVVEDEDALRALAKHILQDAGYEVLEARDGEEAFRLCEARTGPVDLLITDVVMPKVGGPELAQRLRKVKPAMKVLFISGYTANAIVHHGVLEAGVAFLPKPFTPGALAEKVRAVLDVATPRAEA